MGLCSPGPFPAAGVPRARRLRIPSRRFPLGSDGRSHLHESRAPRALLPAAVRDQPWGIAPTDGSMPSRAFQFAPAVQLLDLESLSLGVTPPGRRLVRSWPWRGGLHRKPNGDLCSPPLPGLQRLPIESLDRSLSLPIIRFGVCEPFHGNRQAARVEVGSRPALNRFRQRLLTKALRSRSRGPLVLLGGLRYPSGR